MTVTVTRRKLVNIDPSKNARKFYCLYTSELGHVLFHWGRINTRGQWKSERVEPHEVEDFARRQMYSKLSKGYTREGEDVYQASPDDFQNPTRLEKALEAYRKDVGVSAAQTKALSEIDSFTEQVNSLLTATKERDTGDLMDEYLALKDSWEEIVQRVSTAETAMDMLGMRMRGEI